MTHPCILLAGGKSSRMGTPKGLLSADGQPWLRAQVRRLHDSGATDVVVVLGFDHDRYCAKIPELATAMNTWRAFEHHRLAVVINHHPERGQFSSLQTALHWLAHDPPAGCFILPIDVPAAAPTVWKALAGSLTNDVDAAIPFYQAKGGHPVLISWRFAQQLSVLAPDDPHARLDRQLRRLPPNKIAHVSVVDPTIVRNCNTPDDLPTHCP